MGIPDEFTKPTPRGIKCEGLANVDAVQMTWSAFVTETDIRRAFSKLMVLLDQADKSLDVIMDVQAEPNISVSSTLSYAYILNTHPSMGDWLVIGQEDIAKNINTIMKKAQMSNRVHWFKDEASLNDYLMS